MDYKKLYEEAFERAKKIYNEHKAQPFDVMLKVFPELKESEDERIRKDILVFIRHEGQHIDKYEWHKWIAWLEKQSEIDKASYEISEKEKREFVGDGFIKCFADFQDFKEGETYWLEYISNDNYNVRSDNLLGKTCHITPCQLYTIFKKMTWLEKQAQKSFDYESANIQNKDFAPESTPRYSIGDVLCDKSCTTLNKESQPNFEIIDIRNGMYICDKCSFLISQQDEYELVAKRIEQKPADKVEPKFKVGDWIVSGYNSVAYIESISETKYNLQCKDGSHEKLSVDYINRCWHLWTIQDAKDGDVLSDKYDNIGIFQECEGICWHSYIYLGCDGELRGFNIGGSHEQTDTHPATKEQRDTLLKAMVDAGYKWDRKGI